MVKNQIGTLIIDFSFGHNLCIKYSNESYKPFLDIYVSISFQWYKELFNPMIFYPWNYSLKIWKCIKTPIPKMGAHLQVCGLILSHSLTLSGSVNVIPKLHSRPSPFQALTLVTSLCFDSKSKAKVVTPSICCSHNLFLRIQFLNLNSLRKQVSISECSLIMKGDI